MSDEVELLASIGSTPAACVAVDGYLHTGRDVHFIQIQTPPCAGERAAGVYARLRDDGVGYRDNYVVVVDDPTVSSAVVERALVLVRRLVDEKPVLGSNLQRLL
jgi:hypothetical protein